MKNRRHTPEQTPTKAIWSGARRAGTAARELADSLRADVKASPPNVATARGPRGGRRLPFRPPVYVHRHRPAGP